MKTYVFAEKNGSAIVTLSADTEDEAMTSLADIVKDPESFRLEESEDKEESF
jgi:hypothetical protein